MDRLAEGSVAIPTFDDDPLVALQGAVDAWVEARDAESAAAWRLAKATAAQRLAAEDLTDLARDIGPGAVPERLLWSFYWESEMPAKCIAELAGVHATQLCRLLRPGPTVECHGCGGRAEAVSRSAIKDRVGDHRCSRCDADQAADQAASVAWLRDQDAERRRRTAELRTMRYAEYLRTPEWDGTRRAALRRARYRCQLCGQGDRVLHVHHNTYERRGEERPSDVIALCGDCHARHHGVKD